MKTLFLSIIALATTSLASFAQTTLHDAYMSISDIPGMKVKNDMTVQVNGKADINSARTATAKTDENADRLRNEFSEIIETLPDSEMLINTNDQHEFATVFAEPSDHNLYNVLILQGDAITGVFSATYGTTTADGVKAISSYDPAIDGNDLVLTPMSTTSGHFITMSE
ncbi:MAG: hypothetical protein K2J78_11045 [Muribaculaceae bacterium]|nr:hypothetical protein [Muribaculaceae bacterium]